MANTLAYDYSFYCLFDGSSVDLSINVQTTAFVEGMPTQFPLAVTDARAYDYALNSTATATVDTLGNITYVFASAPLAGLWRVYGRFVF